MVRIFTSFVFALALALAAKAVESTWQPLTLVANAQSQAGFYGISRDGIALASDYYHPYTFEARAGGGAFVPFKQWSLEPSCSSGKFKLKVAANGEYLSYGWDGRMTTGGKPEEFELVSTNKTGEYYIKIKEGSYVDIGKELWHNGPTIAVRPENERKGPWTFKRAPFFAYRAGKSSEVAVSYWDLTSK
ncbi:hypothetical protein FRC12_002015 [Ceratobasidium sp. 428]|nr:hypothetical protein FRC12_002015 [Ceratobasidium sp. 428]